MAAIEILNLVLALAALDIFRRCQDKWRNMLYLLLALAFLTGSVISLAQY